MRGRHLGARLQITCLNFRKPQEVAERNKDSPFLFYCNPVNCEFPWALFLWLKFSLSFLFFCIKSFYQVLVPLNVPTLPNRKKILTSWSTFV